MWEFIKKCFFTAITFFSCSILGANSLECVSMNNQECKARPKIIDVNNNEPVFYPFSIKVNKCCGSCSSINDPYAKLCVPDIIKSLNVKVFNLMQRVNETTNIIWHETCKCVCRLTSAVCNNKQIWNEDKYRCECKKGLTEKMVCNKGYAFNPSICQCECDKSCRIGEYLDYKTCVCRNSTVDKLVEECTVIDENKFYNETLDVTSLKKTLSDVHASCTLYVVLFAVFLTSLIISCGFVYFHWYKKINNRI